MTTPTESDEPDTVTYDSAIVVTHLDCTEQRFPVWRWDGGWPPEDGGAL